MESVTVSNNTSPRRLSAVDALWSLVGCQPKSTRRALAERLIIDDTELDEKLVLKASLQRGWEQVKEMTACRNNEGTQQDFIAELREE